MAHAVRPRRLLVERAAFPPGHEAVLAVGLEREAVRRRAHRTRRAERLLHGALRLRRRVEAAPFKIGTEHDAHGIAHVARAARDARHVEARAVRARYEREAKIKHGETPHAAGHTEAPRRETSSRIGGEGFEAVRVELAAVAVVLEPRPRARPEDEPVAGHDNLRIRGERRIVLAEDLVPRDGQLRVGARPVGEEHLERGIGAHLGSRHRALHARGSGRRRHEHARPRAAHAVRLEHGHLKGVGVAARTVAGVGGQRERGGVVFGTGRGARHVVFAHHAHAEGVRRKDAERAARRHHHVAVGVLGPAPGGGVRGGGNGRDARCPSSFNGQDARCPSW